MLALSYPGWEAPPARHVLTTPRNALSLNQDTSALRQVKFGAWLPPTAAHCLRLPRVMPLVWRTQAYGRHLQAPIMGIIIGVNGMEVVRTNRSPQTHPTKIIAWCRPPIWRLGYVVGLVLTKMWVSTRKPTYFHFRLYIKCWSYMQNILPEVFLWRKAYNKAIAKKIIPPLQVFWLGLIIIIKTTAIQNIELVAI